MAGKEVFLTEEGLSKLKEELEYLKVTKRKENAEKIKIARGFGDLSENAEYDEAKNEQAKDEMRIATLEAMIANVKIIDSKAASRNVSVGSSVVVYDFEFDEEIKYTIVGATESNPEEGRISDESPIGKALLGKKKGEIAEAILPGGEILKLEIRKVTKK